MALQRLLTLDEEEVRAGRRSPDTVDFHRTKAGHLVRVFETDEKGEHVAFMLERLRAAEVDGYISRRRQEGAADTTTSKEPRGSSEVAPPGHPRRSLARARRGGHPGGVLPWLRAEEAGANRR